MACFQLPVGRVSSPSFQNLTKSHRQPSLDQQTTRGRLQTAGPMRIRKWIVSRCGRSGLTGSRRREAGTREQGREQVRQQAWEWEREHVQRVTSPDPASRPLLLLPGQRGQYNIINKILMYPIVDVLFHFPGHSLRSGKSPWYSPFWS